MSSHTNTHQSGIEKYAAWIYISLKGTTQNHHSSSCLSILEMQENAIIPEYTRHAHVRQRYFFPGKLFPPYTDGSVCKFYNGIGLSESHHSGTQSTTGAQAVHRTKRTKMVTVLSGALLKGKFLLAFPLPFQTTT